MQKEVKDQIVATIYGQCVGDALGLLTEFMTKIDAKKYYGRRPKDLKYSQKVPDFHRSRWQEGDWTDDSDHMIVIMQSILNNKGQILVTDFALRIKRWMEQGFPELGDYGGMGIGKTTSTVLKHHNFTTDPHKVSYECWDNSQRNIAPNGAVMRTSVLGIHHFDDLEAVVSNTLDICKTTHADPRCQASCVAVSVCISLMLQHTAKQSPDQKSQLDVESLVTKSYEQACRVLGTEEEKKELFFYMNCSKLKKLQLTEPGKIGYTYKCLGAGFWALRQKDFKKAMIKLIMEGGDADTNAAVAGAMLGCALGRSAIPDLWITGLKHREWLSGYIDRFLKLQEEMKLPVQQRSCYEDLDMNLLTESDARLKEERAIAFKFKAAQKRN
ncbi:unnamed protein product [Lymnaea stagnalis]|uniref:Uncharacterized protein n=1 Tax=Lymnaea stagnalis TaxID=6523 RepID=A0AAV2HD48_LYMST